MAADDGSEDINDFLLRIRELGDQRDREDEERTRKLEEEILQGRKERQARRAERARSISPTKEPISPASSIRSTADNPLHERATRSPVTLKPPSQSIEESLNKTPANAAGEPPAASRASTSREVPQPPSKPETLSTTPPSSMATPSRAGTLSWQQRPSSRGSTGSRARPLSQFAAENNASRSPRPSVEPPSTSEREVSRDEIAQSLSSKNPTWFRQTQDRGQGSAAYRRNQEESTSSTISSMGSMRLPGMSRQVAREPERQGSSESLRSASPSRGDSLRGGSFRQVKDLNSASLSSSNGIRSPMPITNSQIFQPPSTDLSTLMNKDPSPSTTEAVSSSQGRISPERLDRPTSPTKGLGGFVQSAMLKRSDSVNKRWGAQPGAGLSRGNSVASNRSGYEGPKYGLSGLGAPKDQNLPASSRETSPVASSRPGSSHSNATLTRHGRENERPSLSALAEQERSTPPSDTRAVTPTPPPDEAIETSSGNSKTSADPPVGSMNPPASPSKRWSPTKSSWLENAINKPDSPKPKMAPPSQPSWMTNISQAKQQRGNVDLGKGTNFKEVSTGGFLRSPPMGASTMPRGIGNVRTGPTPEKAGNVITTAPGGVPTTSVNDASSPSQDLDNSIRSSQTPEKPIGKELSMSPSIRTPSSRGTPSGPNQEGSSMGVDENASGSPRPSKPKPEAPPKKDFRSNLKPRQVSADKKPAEEAEFKNVFGKLKRTQTQNYVAPDELKDNIMRGKAGLAVTGGPKKTERRDEFKERLLKQKEAMKAGPPPAVGRKPSIKDTAKDNPPSSNGLQSKTATRHAESGAADGKQQPEALARLQRLKEKSQPASTPIPSAPLVKPHNVLPSSKPSGNDFNSSLAGMLSRGPPPAASSASKPSNDDSEPKLSPSKEPTQSTGQGPQLTHMTKSRARGPKRRAPATSSAKDISASPTAPAPVESDSNNNLQKVRSLPNPSTSPTSSRQGNAQTRSIASISDNIRKPSQPEAPRKPSIAVKQTESPKATSSASPTIIPHPSPAQPKTSTFTPSEPLSPPIDRLRKPSATFPPTPTLTSASPRPESLAEKTRAPADSLPAAREPKSSATVKGAAAKWSQVEAPARKASPPRARSPIKLPTRKDEEAAMQDAGLSGKGDGPNGLGITTGRPEPRSPLPTPRSLPTPPMSSPKSPPLPAKKPASIISRVVSNIAADEQSSKTNGSTTPQTSEASRLFAELFDESPSTDVKVNIDTPAALASRASTTETEKIRTLRKQIWEITAGGKLIPVPSDQSHILFEESLYICHHVFGSLTGTRTTEVYLWCGDGVATSAVEDAQIFARKEAKDHGGKLVVLSQGKETARFFQALGGIVITRH
ncbi:MAG: hypothetical protein Q9174_003817, partial [Haloplaca sp. 1 TL-2023]